MSEASAAWSGTPVIGLGGRAAAELGAGRPPGTPDSSDHELSACAFPGAEVRAASVRGLLHRHRDQPRQDRFSLVHDPATNTLVITVCDGVGSLPRSQEAAAFVARYMPLEYLASGDWATAVKYINQELAAFAADPGEPTMATTFVGVAIRLGQEPRTASVAWTDDSTVWRLEAGGWTKLTVDEPSTDDGPHRVGVRALPHPEPRFRSVEVPAGRGALFVLTDGIGVPLEEAAEVRDTLAAWWAGPPDVFEFGRQVAFARKSHIDDRTAVGVWFGAKD